MVWKQDSDTNFIQQDKTQVNIANQYLNFEVISRTSKSHELIGNTNNKPKYDCIFDTKLTDTHPRKLSNKLPMALILGRFDKMDRHCSSVSTTQVVLLSIRNQIYNISYTYCFILFTRHIGIYISALSLGNLM